MDPRMTITDRRTKADQYIDPRVNDHISELRTKGITFRDNALNPEQCVELYNYFRGQPAYNMHVPAQSDRVPRPVSPQYPFASHTLEQCLKAPYLLDIALDPVNLYIGEQYLRCEPTLYSLHCWWSFPGPGGIHNFHRDFDDYNFLSTIIYLTDVTPTNGPFSYQIGSHIGPGKEVYTYTGNAGTTMMADTYGIHRGEKVQSGHRLAVWYRYGLEKNRAYIGDETMPVPGIKVKPEHKNITRLIINHE